MTSGPGKFPPLGGPRPRPDSMRILAHQTFEQRHDHMMLGRAGDDVRIQVLRLGAVVQVEHLFAITDLDPRLSPSAAGQHGDREKAETGVKQTAGKPRGTRIGE